MLFNLKANVESRMVEMPNRISNVFIDMQVDCTEPGKDSCSKHKVSGYPTLKIFKNGELLSDYDGPREHKGIVKYMQKKVGPASVDITSVDAFASKLDKNVVVLAAFFESEDKIDEFKKAADKVRDTVLCVHSSSPDVMKKYGHKK